MNRKPTIECDMNKLKHEFKKRNLSDNDVATELGLSRYYFKNVYARNRISEQTAKGLEKCFNIKPQDFAPDKPEPANAPKEVAVKVEPFDWQKLYNVMYEAMYNAVKKAWSE